MLCYLFFKTVCEELILILMYRLQGTEAFLRKESKRLFCVSCANLHSQTNQLKLFKWLLIVLRFYAFFLLQL